VLAEEHAAVDAAASKRSEFVIAIHCITPEKGRGTLEVFLKDTRGGSERDKVTIPVNFKPGAT